MSEQANPFGEAERAANLQAADIVRNLFGGSDAEVLQAVLEELRAIRSVLERWDAQGVPSTRNDGL